MEVNDLMAVVGKNCNNGRKHWLMKA